MRFRIWEERSARVLPALGIDGPLTVQPGEVVVVAVVRSIGDATKFVDAITHAAEVAKR